MIWECPFCEERMEFDLNSPGDCALFCNHIVECVGADAYQALGKRSGRFTTCLVCGEEPGFPEKGRGYIHGSWARHFLTHPEQTNKYLVLLALGGNV